MDFINELVAIAKEHGGIIQAKVAAEHGISKAMLYKLCQEDKIHRIVKGQYVLPNELGDEFLAISNRSAKIIFSHESALFLHGISDRTPFEHTITAPSNNLPSAAVKAECKVYYIKPELFALGKTVLKTPAGNDVPAYDLERTICDCIRSRNKIGTETFLAALKMYTASPKKNYIRRIMVTFLCAKLYYYSVNFKNNKFSMHLVIDEAHNYLSAQNLDKEDAIAKTCIDTFESIIKEGRKFGVFLTMATQRPSDITPTLLSQSHNYVIHKLVNPRDIDIMKHTVPFIDEMSITMLSILSPGQAIFSGTAFNRPNIVQIKFDDSKTKVESDTIKLMNKWRRKRNFDEDSLKIAKHDVQQERELADIIGIPTTIASEELECPECGEKYICILGNYAPYGMCLNCGVQHKLLQCTYCNEDIILDEDAIVDEPI